MSRKRKTQATRASAKKARQQGAVYRDGAGRLHLNLHRDPTTGRARLVLKNPIFHEGWQNDLAVAAANTTVGTMREMPSAERAVELARHTLDVASEMSDGFLARLPEGTIACKAGCDHCCHQAVHLTPVEALAIVEHLRRSLSATDLTDLAVRMSDARTRTHDLPPLDRNTSDHPCPFLAAGRCSIYEVRPLACRGMNSHDAASCARILRDRVARAEFLSNPRAGTSFAEPIRISLALSAGLQLALSEVYQLDMHPLELTAAMDLLLSSEPLVAAGWLSGQPTFALAYAPEVGNDARIRTLGGLVTSEPSHPARG